MRYKIITENVTNAYILDEQNNEIVSLCNTKRPDKGFESLKRLIEYANKYIDMNSDNEFIKQESKRIKKPIERSYMLYGIYPWIIEIQTGKGIEIKEAMTLGEVEKKFNLKDGDSILELRPLREYTLTRENGDWYMEKTGMGYA